MKITKVEDENVFNVEFTRKSGDVMEFYAKFIEISEHMFKRLNYLN